MAVKPRLLDLFCGAGGCAKGYELAGFQIEMGVDKKEMPRYPYDFTCMSALDFLEEYGHEYDFIHASPPCQTYSAASNVAKSQGREYETFLPQTRELLKSIGVPYIIENVVGAPIEKPILLCGTMFGLNVIRHRLFETSFEFSPSFMPLCHHTKKVVAQGYVPKENEYHCVTGHFSDIEAAKKAMGIDWMIARELAQAIPPQYTQFLGAVWLQSQGLPHQFPDMGIMQKTLFAAVQNEA